MSEPFELLVLGGGPAGFSAARAYRAAGGRGGVAIVTDEHRMPYSRPPLTKALLRGEMAEADLPLERESFLREQAIDLVSGRAVVVDGAARTVGLSGGRQLAYRRCVMATGAEPTRLPVPGADHPGVRVIRTLDDVREVLARLGRETQIAVVGSGFIGCEIAASLRRRSHRVALVSDERAPNAERLGAAVAARIHGWLEREGVTVHLGAAVERIAAEEAGLRVEAEHGVTVACELVILATGVAPRSELAAAAGIELIDGAVPVDATLRTAHDGIWAAGDVAFAHNAAAGRRLRVEHWGDALGQGEVAGRSAAGAGAQWDAVPGFWSTIGEQTLKYAAWGDGFDDVRLDDHGEAGAFTAWYGRAGTLVGVLAHRCDDDYERGRALIAAGAPWR